MKPKKFRKKPVVIEALPFDGSNHNDIKRFTQGGCYIDVNDPQNPRFMIRTLEGEHIASPGDVIIRGVKGEFYPCKPEIFALTYEDEAENTRSDAHLLRSPKEDQIKRMVNRFLQWKLPENFNPDGGISFKRMRNENTEWPARNEPVGTNLLDANQAEDMVRFMLEGIEA
jgi:hypothetical protein